MWERFMNIDRRDTDMVVSEAESRIGQYIGGWIANDPMVDTKDWVETVVGVMGKALNPPHTHPDAAYKMFIEVAACALSAAMWMRATGRTR
jgi:hypothetical protein